MSETTWLPLPTHDGGWWIRYEGRTKVINVTMEDEGPCCDDDDVLLTERDDVRYYPIPDPPADGEKLTETDSENARLRRQVERLVEMVANCRLLSDDELKLGLKNVLADEPAATAIDKTATDPENTNVET